MILTRIKGHRDYSVSPDGVIVSHKWGKLRKLAQIKNKPGYLSVKLDGQRCLVHRLVARAFIPNPQGAKTVNHKNGIKGDNRIENLEWATLRENLHHAMREGLHANPMKAVECIETRTVYESQTEAARRLGVHQPNISKVLTGERRRAGGFSFREVL